MIHRVSKGRVVNSRSLMVEGGAEHVESLLDDVEQGLDEADLGATTRWRLREVAVAERWWSEGRTWLAIEHRQVRDVRQYVRCRPYGTHLEVVHLTTIEPPRWKAWGASLLHRGAWWHWSLPPGELAETSLASWQAVVTHVIQGATRRLAQRLGRGGGLRRLDTDALAWW